MLATRSRNALGDKGRALVLMAAGLQFWFTCGSSSCSQVRDDALRKLRQGSTERNAKERRARDAPLELLDAFAQVGDTLHEELAVVARRGDLPSQLARDAARVGDGLFVRHHFTFPIHR